MEFLALGALLTRLILMYFPKFVVILLEPIIELFIIMFIGFIHLELKLQLLCLVIILWLFLYYALLIAFSKMPIFSIIALERMSLMKKLHYCNKT